MSVMTKAIGTAKKIKQRYGEAAKARAKVYLSPVRRIERVALNERVCAMTFDDGPCRLPASPDGFDGRALTLVLAETLERYGAHGSFDVVGDTSGNYPDVPGKEGSAAWGGVAFDHYPDFGKDADGGAVHCPELIDRLLAGGHEITSHSYEHILFGHKALVYGRRRSRENFASVVADLRRLDDLLRNEHGFVMRLSRPPHYVDKIKGGLTSYDAYAALGYQYMAASFDGAGWLPLASYEAEVEETWKPLAEKLAQDPDFFCGQIIFQKDGYNMARRSPVADGLPKQLELLSEKGYRVVSASELLALSSFSDALPDSAAARNARVLLEAGWCPVYRDNTLRPENVLTNGELAMLCFGVPGAQRRTDALLKKMPSAVPGMKTAHPYYGAVSLALEAGAMQLSSGRFRADEPVNAETLALFMENRFGEAPKKLPEILTHGAFFALTAEQLALVSERTE